MSRRNKNSDSSWLIGLLILGAILYAKPGIGILLAIGGVVLYSVFAWNSSGKSKTVTNSKTFFGNRKKRIEYHDTGKVVEQVTSPTWTGGTKKETKVVQQGPRQSSGGVYGRGARPQTCRRCNATITGVEGRYTCSCGHRWGRP